MPDETPIFWEGEVMLANWTDHHSLGPRITFYLQDSGDLEPFRTCTVRKAKQSGQRFQMVLVEIGDDEKPMHHPSSSAHLMLTGPEFLAYAKSQGPNREGWDSARAREWAKYVMQVESLADIDKDPAALMRFERLVRKPFAEWNGAREGSNYGENVDRDGAGVDEDPGEPKGV